jgi:polar amino acid transport system substrate-binding protein
LGLWFALCAIVLTAGLTGTARAERTYTCGSAPDAAPFAFRDDATESVRGVMIDVIKAVAVDAGFAVDFQPIAAGSEISSLTGGRVDIVPVAFRSATARADGIDLSDPVYVYGEGAVVRDSSEYGSVDDFKGQIVGVLVGSASASLLRQSAALKAIRTYDSVEALLHDVEAGRVAGAIADYPTLAYHLTHGSYRGIHLAKSYRPRIVWTVSIGVRAGDALLPTINRSLARLKAYGRIDRILADWKLR